MTNKPQTVEELGSVEIGAPEVNVAAESFWIHNGQTQIERYVSQVAQSQIDTFVSAQLEAVKSIASATEKTAGIIRIATADEAWQGIDNDVALTPQKARAGFLDKERFEQFQMEIDNRLDSKVDSTNQEELEAVVDDLDARIGSVNEALDILNGAII